MRTLKVSRATAGFIARGHPWVRPDRFTVGLDALSAGEAVTLVDERGVALAAALADPQAEVCARVYARRPDAAFAPAAAYAAAWERRAGLHVDPDTDCYRVVHGEADGLPGLRVERYADVLVVLVLADCASPSVEAVCAAAQRLLPRARIVVRDHRDDLRVRDVATRLHGGAEVDAEAMVIGREFGLRYPVRPFAGLATGLYVDQRATRRWLRARCGGARILNLFAYTGAFSLALLAAGAAQATDVDLSAPALARGREAADLNAVGARYHQEHADCLDWLATCEAAFDIIISDPPTAAQGGGGWIARRDYPRLMSAILPRLAPNGWLIAASNTIGGKPLDLDEMARDASSATRVALRDERGPDLDGDIPQIPGFPEGRPFRLAVRRRG